MLGWSCASATDRENAVRTSRIDDNVDRSTSDTARSVETLAPASGQDLTAVAGFTASKTEFEDAFRASVGVFLDNPNPTLAALDVHITVRLMDEAGATVGTDKARVNYVPAGAQAFPVAGFASFGEIPTGPIKATIQTVVGGLTTAPRREALEGRPVDDKGYELEVVSTTTKPGLLGDILALEVKNPTDQLIEHAKVECVSLGLDGRLTGGAWTVISGPIRPGASLAIDLGDRQFRHGQEVASGKCVVTA